MSGIIKAIHAREVFNAKGLPTIEVEITLDDGTCERAAAPGGTSRGMSETFDLRDGDPNYFNGKGVNNAIANVNNEIATALKGKDATDQATIDRLMIALDGTENKSHLGGNALIATSIACAKAAARSQEIPICAHLGGGTHIPTFHATMMFGGPAYVGVKGTVDFQEYSLIALGADSYRQGFYNTLKINERLSAIIAEKQGFGIPKLAQVAGTLSARFDSNDEALGTMTELITEAGFTPRRDFGIYLDIASGQLYQNGKYYIKSEDKLLSREDWIDRLDEICRRYPIISIEDALYEEDWEGWQLLTKRLGNKVQLVGDDLFVTNPKRLQKGIELGVANATVIKPNQIGTLSEAMATVKLAKSAGYGTVISPRSGEIPDPYLMHFCVGQNLEQGKFARCPAGGDHLDEILRIMDYLGDKAVYRGKEVYSRFL